MMMLEHSVLDFCISQGQGQLYDDDLWWWWWFMMMMIYVDDDLCWCFYDGFGHARCEAAHSYILLNLFSRAPYRQINRKSIYIVFFICTLWDNCYNKSYLLYLLFFNILYDIFNFDWNYFKKATSEPWMV